MEGKEERKYMGEDRRRKTEYVAVCFFFPGAAATQSRSSTGAISLPSSSLPLLSLSPPRVKRRKEK